MFDIVMGKQVPLSESAPRLDAKVAAVVMKAMAAPYDARYEDPRDLSRDFRDAVLGR
jgi:hypothetical protein